MTDETGRADAPLFSRATAEIAAALLTLAFGAVVMAGSVEFGIGWDVAGPEAGTFPFMVGGIIVAASLTNLLTAWRRRAELATPILTRRQLGRVVAFAGPVVAFAVGSLWLGLYVAGALYLLAVMVLQGGYRIWQGAAVGVAAALFFYVVLERWFQVPLLKGPLEALLGIH